MARRTNVDKGKDSLELLGVKIDPALKKAIEDEGGALGIAMSTYARQLLIIGWQSRHNAPIAKNPRELILSELFNELPLNEQENVITMVEALHKKHSRESRQPSPAYPTSPVTDRNPTLEDNPIPTESIDPLGALETLKFKRAKKGGSHQ